MGGGDGNKTQTQTFPSMSPASYGKGPKELAGLYEPSSYTPRTEPEQEQDYPSGMLHPPTVSSSFGSLRDSLTAEFDGITYIIPMTDGDHVLSEEEAIQRFLKTHDHMGGFDSLNNANSFRQNDDEILDFLQ